MCRVCAVVEEPHGLLADLRAEVRVAHRHLDGRVTE
jgi:hypothetical protein